MFHRHDLTDSPLGAQRQPPQRRSVVVALLVSLLALLAGAWRPAQRDEARPQEYRVKAAYLYNFALFVEWPEERFEREDGPFVVGVLGQDPFGAVLDRTFEGKRIGKHEVRVVRFPTVADLDDCHVLFAAAEQLEHVAAITAFCRPRSVLLVSDREGFLGRGGVVELFIEERTVRFAIQVDEARRYGLRVSSKVLKLARIVRDAEPGGDEEGSR